MERRSNPVRRPNDLDNGRVLLRDSFGFFLGRLLGQVLILSPFHRSSLDLRSFGQHRILSSEVDISTLTWSTPVIAMASSSVSVTSVAPIVGVEWIVISSCVFSTPGKYQYDNHVSNGTYSPRSGKASPRTQRMTPWRSTMPVRPEWKTHSSGTKRSLAQDFALGIRSHNNRRRSSTATSSTG
jgi:hypothetical protein